MKHIFLKSITLILVMSVLLSCVGMVTFAEGEPYKLIGIENGDKIFLNENMGKTVNVVDAVSADTLSIHRNTAFGASPAASNVPITRPNAEAAGVHHVDYYIDNILVATDGVAPFVQTLPITRVGAGTLVAEIYDSETNLVQTIERSFTGVYSVEKVSWSEDFEGVFSKIGTTRFDEIPLPTSISTHLDVAGAEGSTAEQAIITHPVNGTKGLKILLGTQYPTGFHVGLMPATLAEGKWINDKDWSSNSNRIFMEFDYSIDPWLGFTIKLREGFLESNDTYNTDYANIVLPSALVSKNPATAIMTRIGLDISWDNSAGTVSYIVYLNGQECYRDTTKRAWKNSFDPSKLMVELCRAGSAAAWSCYLDNIRITAHESVHQGQLYNDAPTVNAFFADDTSAGDVGALSNLAEYFTLSMPDGASPAPDTVNEENVWMTHVINGQEKEVALTFDDGKIILGEQLHRGATYMLHVTDGVKTAAGKRCMGTQTVSITVSSGDICIDSTATGFSLGELPAVGTEVTSSAPIAFSAKITGDDFVGKSAQVVLGVYDGSRLKKLSISPAGTIPADGILPSVSVYGFTVTENTKIEAFVIDSEGTMVSISDSTFVLE
ncbi:MAG: hypothetical protein E7400_03800 [Ruminococcaceae bacterium]|nr:hypothetical protein [Oscillospiraceae bacterium]